MVAKDIGKYFASFGTTALKGEGKYKGTRAIRLFFLTRKRADTVLAAMQ
jgi:hypothetical protein